MASLGWEDQSKFGKVDTFYKLSASWFRRGNKRLGYALGSSLYMIDDANIDLAAQGVRAAGKFDSNYVLFVGGQRVIVLTDCDGCELWSCNTGQKLVTPTSPVAIASIDARKMLINVVDIRMDVNSLLLMISATTPWLWRQR